MESQKTGRNCVLVLCTPSTVHRTENSVLYSEDIVLYWTVLEYQVQQREPALIADCSIARVVDPPRATTRRYITHTATVTIPN